LGHGPESLGTANDATHTEDTTTRTLDTALSQRNASILGRATFGNLTLDCRKSTPGAPVTAVHEFPTFGFGDTDTVTLSVVNPKSGEPTRAATMVADANGETVVYDGDIDTARVLSSTAYKMTAMLGGSAFRLAVVPDGADHPGHRALFVTCSER